CFEDPCGGAEDNRAFGSWISRQINLRHTIAQLVAQTVIQMQVLLMGGNPDNVKIEYPIEGGSKNPKSPGNTGYADIVYTAPDGTVYVWEVKSAGVGDAQAAAEVQHYIAALEAKGIHAVPGWKIGTGYVGVDPASGEVITVGDGGSPGSIIYTT